MKHRFDLTEKELTTGWFHLGANLPEGHADVTSGTSRRTSVRPMQEHRTVLMVGTIEPRKGHAQVLDAFDLLWRNGAEQNLIIAGKQGWHVESFVERLREHPEIGKRLFWFPDINDVQLAQLYVELDGLVMASEAEGFGLPLVEAAQYGMPLFVRDLAVFREVAGEHATYFTAQRAEELALQLAEWLDQLDCGTAPGSQAMKSLTWSASAAQLKALIAKIGSRG